MPKNTPDYDNVFKTMKSKHKRLFIPVINDIFEKEYPLDAEVEVLPSEGYLTESETEDGSREIKEKISDFLIKIESEVYLLECQSYDDGSMAIRIAEYAFIAARQFATWDIGHAKIPLPRFSVIYVKRTDRTPKTTSITFTFPSGQEVKYESENVILEEFTKEYIMEKRLFPYIPFYISRYEKEILSENGMKPEKETKSGKETEPGKEIKSEKDTESGATIENAVKDLEYFRDEMIRLYQKKELSEHELIDLKGFVNTIITHITNGNQDEERLVSVMGGTVIETESERLIRLGKSEGIREGIREGMENERYQTIRCMLQRGKTSKEISDFCEYDLSYVKQVEESMAKEA